MNKNIPRIVEIEALRLISQFLAVALVGPRLVGKTNLAKHPTK